MASDDELLQAWRAGDRAAGDAFIRRMFPTVRRFLASKCGNEIEELVQETFSRTAQAKERFAGRSSAKTFVLGVARNVLREHYRGRARGDADLEESSVIDLGAGASTLRWRRKADELLLQGLRGLPLRMQTALELYYWEGLNKREISEVLDIPEGTVASRMERAKERLRELFEGPAAAADDAAGSLDGWADQLRASAPLQD